MTQESSGSVSIDQEKQRKAKEYARIERRLMVVNLLISGLYFLLWVLLGWSVRLKSLLVDIFPKQWLLILGFAAIFGGVLFVLELPLSYYSGYILPHRYKLSTQSIKDWIVDQLKGLVVGGLLGAVVLEMLYYFLNKTPDMWWLWLALFMLVFNVLLANLAPVVLFPIFYKFEPISDEHSDLEERLLRLAEKSGTKVKGVYKFDMSRRTTAANAGLTGLGNTRRIILGDTMLDEFTPDEIETVLAHELGHHINNDIPLSIGVQSLITLGGFYLASLFMDWGVSQFGFQGVNDIAALPWLGIVLGGYGLVTMPLTNAFSRWRENLADRYALQVTQNGEAYASALQRLANQNLAEIDPEPWVEFLLYSHPALGKRIKLAKQFVKR